MDANSLGWLVQSSSTGIRSLGLLPGLLEALQAIRNADTATVEWSEALRRLLTALESGDKPPTFADDDWSALMATWSGLKDTLRSQFPNSLRALTYKLSDFATPGAEAGPNPIEYPLTVAGSAAGAPVLAGLSFTTSANASATAALALQVFDHVPELISGLGYPGPANEYVLRIGLRGDLSAGATATAAPAWGKVSASAGVTAGAYLDHYFHFPASRYLAQTLIEALPQMVRPGDLAALLRVVRQPVEVGDFAMAITELNGSLNLGGELGVDVSVQGSFGSDLAGWSKSNDGQPATVTAELALSASFKWDVAGSFRTVARQVGSNAHLRIERTRGSTSGVGISAGAVIDVSGLQALLDPVVARFLPASEPLTSRLGKLADLRGLALGAAEKALGLDGSGSWDDVAKKLLQFAGGADTDAAKGALTDALAQAFDALAKDKLASKDAALADAPAKIAVLIGSALGGLDVSAIVGPVVKQVAEKLDGEVTTAYEKFRGQVTEQITGSIASILSVPSSSLDGLFQQIQSRVSAFTTPLVEWIKKYESLRTKLAKAIAQVESERLALNWSYSFEKECEASTIVEVAFEQDTPAARALYRAMCAGDLGRYAALKAACEKDGSARQVSWLDEASQTRRVSSGIVLDLFGWQSMTTTLTALDKVAIGVDDTGRIVSASDVVQLVQMMSLRKKTTRAAVDLRLELFAAGKTPPLSTVYSATGEALTIADERAFYALLAAAGAVSPGAADRMRALLWGGSATGDASLKDTELSVWYQPDDREWAHLVAVRPEDIELKVRVTGLEMLEAAIRSGGERGLPEDGMPKAWIAGWLQETGMTESQFWREAATSPTWAYFHDGLIKPTNLPPASGFPRGKIQSAVYSLWQVARIARAISDAWKNVAEVNLLLARLRSPTPGISRDEAYQQLSNLSGDIRVELTRVFDRAIPDVKQTTKVSWQYLVLVLALARLASADDKVQLVTKAKAKRDGTERTFFVS